MFDFEKKNGKKSGVLFWTHLNKKGMQPDHWQKAIECEAH